LERAVATGSMRARHGMSADVAMRHVPLAEREDDFASPIRCRWGG
jgi:hypothetical protein